MVQKNLGSVKIFQSKKIGCKKISGLKIKLGPKKNWIQKNDNYTVICGRMLTSSPTHSQSHVWRQARCLKMLGLKKYWVWKNFESEKDFGSKKNFGSRWNSLSEKNVLSEKYFGQKKILGLKKNFGAEKEIKKIWHETILTKLLRSSERKFRHKPKY